MQKSNNSFIPLYLCTVYCHNRSSRVLCWLYSPNEFILLINWILSATVYSDILSGDSNMARCLTSWYDAVPALDISGCIGRSSIVPVGLSLTFLAVP